MWTLHLQRAGGIVYPCQHLCHVSVQKRCSTVHELTDVLPEDQQPLLATTAPNGTNNRLSYESTVTTNSNPRSRSTEITESTATAYTDLDLRDSKASARTTTAYPDHQGRDLNDSEYSRTAYPEYQGQYPNSAEPKYMNSRVQELNGDELDYGKTRTRNTATSQLESSSITPRPSLRHKTSSPSLRKPS